jgi:S1-C subfamily serine protease
MGGSELVAVAADSESSPTAANDIPASVIAAQNQRIAAIAKASAVTVGVFGSDDAGGGSGVVISPDGYVLTNFHVSSPFGYRMRCGLPDGKMYEAILCGIDPTGDLALLKMYGRDDFPTATIADSDDCEVGQWCYAIGNPFVLNTNLQPTVTYGLISGVHRYQYPSGSILEYSDCLQTDAAINPGNSGGPLFNAEGDLIGINGRCSFEKRGRVNVGVGYAISINQAMNFLGVLKSGRIVDHATFGFTVNTDENGEVLVSNILESCDAFRRGLRYQDRIIEFAGYPIKTANQLKNYLGIYPANWRLPLIYEQDGERVETFIRLESLHRPEELDAIVNGQSPQAKPTQGDLKEDDPKEDDPKEQPAEGEQPTDSDPGTEGEDSEREDSSNSSAGQASKADQDALADRYIARQDFGNYYFNLQNFERLKKLQSDDGDWESAPDVVVAKGTIAAEPTPVEITLTDSVIDYSSNGESITIGDALGYANLVDTQQTETIAIGLQMVRRWHSVGPRLLGDAVYIGTAPALDPRDGQSYSLMDKTRVVVGDLYVYFYSELNSGDIRLIEIEADPTRDPAEIYLSSYESFDGLRCPTVAMLRYGMETKLVLQLDEWTFRAKAVEKTEGEKQNDVPAPAKGIDE